MCSHIMRRILFSLSGLLFLGIQAQGQMLTPQVLAAGGDVFSNTQANLNISFTIGEMAMVETFSAQGYHLTQGFQQPRFDLVGIEEEEFVNLFEVYPNPAAGELFVRYDLSHPGNLDMRLFSMNGVQVVDGFEQNYAGGLELHSFDLSGVAQGMYFLEVKYKVPSRQIDHVSHFKINVINP